MNRAGQSEDESRESTDSRLSALVAEYVDRVSRGESISHSKILKRHPEDGPALLRALETFLSLDESVDVEPECGEFGDYRLQRELGRGGMGVVYDAWQASMDRRVALKLLPPAVAANDRAAARLAREARVIGRLRHPSITPVFGMGVENGTPYFAMEFVDGETVASVLRRLRAQGGQSDLKLAGAGPAATVLDTERIDDAYAQRTALLFADVADGLQHAHESGVVHRDVKPSNIMVDRSGRLRLLDFGLARLDGEATVSLSGDRLGTPLYMSPEQAVARRTKIDHRTDVYSLGVTLYEVLTWTTPFRGRTHDDTLSQIIHRDPPPLRTKVSDLPTDVETIVLKCLRKPQDDRYGTAEALAQDLRRFARGEPIEARPETSADRWLRWIRSRRASLAVGVLLCALAITAAILSALVVRNQARERVERFETRVSDAGSRLLRDVTTRAELFGDAIGSRFELLRPEDLKRLKRSPAGPVDGAVGVLEVEAKALPERFEAHFFLSRAYHVLGAAEKARASLQRSLELRPGFAPAAAFAEALGLEPISSSLDAPWGALWVEAERRMRDARWTDALESYDTLRREYGDQLFLGSTLEVVLKSGVAALKAGRIEDAIECFVEARNFDRTHSEPHLLLASAYLAKEHIDQADRTLTRYFNGSDDKTGSAAWIAATYHAYGYPEQALEWTHHIQDAALRIRAEALCWVSFHRYDKALELAEEALDRNPSSVSCRMLFGNVAATVTLSRAGQKARELNDRAIATFEGMTAFVPDSPVLAYGGYTDLLRRRGQSDRAQALLEDAVRRFPDEPRIHSSLTRHWSFVGDSERTIESFERARQLRGAHVPGSSWVEYACVLLAYQLSGRPRRAEAEAVAATRRFPRSGWLYTIWGHNLREQGHPEEAIERYKRSIKSNVATNGAVPLVRLLVKAGRIEDAVHTAYTAVETAPDSPVALSALARALLAAGRAREAGAAAVQARLLEPKGRRYSQWFLYELLRDSPTRPTISRLDELARTYEREENQRALGAEERLNVALARAFAPSPDHDGARLAATAALDSDYRERALVVLALLAAERGDALDAVQLVERSLRYEGDVSARLKLLDRLQKSCELPYPSYASIDRRLAEIAGKEPKGARRGTRTPLYERHADSTALARIAKQGSSLVEELRTFPNHSAVESVHTYLKGRILAAAGDMAGAADQFRSVVGVDPTAVEARIRLAEALWSVGSVEAAHSTIDTILSPRRHTGTLRDRLRWVWIDLNLNKWNVARSDLVQRLRRTMEAAPADDSDRHLEPLLWILTDLEQENSLRVNCQGPSFNDELGRLWRRDAFFFIEGEHPWVCGETLPTVPAELYQTHRSLEFSKNLAAYRIPLRDGRYRVRLHFAERHVTAPGYRVFDVVLEGVTVLDDYGPLEVVGLHKPDVREFDVEVTDGRLDLDLRPESGKMALLCGFEIERR